MFGTLGVQEIMVIFLVALVLFGPKKLPELGRTIGKAITEFRRASNDLKSTFEREMQNLERESELKEIAAATTADIQSSASTTYDYPYYDESGAYNPEPYEIASDNHPATHPSTVDVSEVPGVESHGTHDTAGAVSGHTESTHSVEGTVPRSDTAHTESVETSQHS